MLCFSEQRLYISFFEFFSTEHSGKEISFLIGRILPEIVLNNAASFLVQDVICNIKEFIRGVLLDLCPSQARQFSLLVVNFDGT